MIYFQLEFCGHNCCHRDRFVPRAGELQRLDDFGSAVDHFLRTPLAPTLSLSRVSKQHFQVVGKRGRLLGVRVTSYRLLCGLE
jgi:hypothetical protein